ncbi:hypothetical protein N801_11215 [Knoellia aerolata DSM 18566]|uniref:Acyltransferase 3 domain-containing protein n=1 Tax=Knoellia aerolata DSM 18566 TaxID=1385519 RepID=A0A0A0JZH0_9MICO|nr:hypothetical protein N801_11215 [Knoellia aerolata DSM 18566]
MLIVLSHGWTVYPFDDSARIAPLDALLFAGNVAVTIFLVVSGYLVTRSMLSARERYGPSGPWRTFTRRILRISASVLVLLFAVALMSEVDDSDTNSQEATQKSILRVATYTWNWYVRANPLEARGDLGPLWYLSVEMQFYVVLALVLAVWGARRRHVSAALVLIVLLVTWWRWHSYDLEGWYGAPLRTTTRVDGLVWGALVGLLLPHLASLKRDAHALLGATSLVMLGVVFTSARYDIGDYMKLQGLIMAATVALFVAANQLSGPSAIKVILSSRPLRALGSVSLTIYIWHSPIFWAVSRHTSEWGNLSRSMLAVGLLAAVTVLAHRYVDGPVQRWTENIGRGAPAVENVTSADTSPPPTPHP